jgi:lipid-A-disaccharide synthase
MKYFIIAGEQSGDLHGSNLIRGISQADPQADIHCWGGQLMKEAGGNLLVHYRKLAFMGFMNVLLNIRTVLRNMALCKKQILVYSPDVLILIDYPGFNLRIAQFAKSAGLKVFYYISPKLWAWKESRVMKVREYVDRMFIIFPFEVEFYRKHGIGVTYYGNPLVDEIEKKSALFRRKEEIRMQLGLDEKPVIAMLAGSRRHEIEHILPEMVKITGYFTGYQFVLAGVDKIPAGLYERIIGARNVKVISGRTYEILGISEAALVKSGTSTLEAALLGVPQVVCYKGDAISFAIARRLVKVRFISLVNLILGREAVTELIQFLLTEQNLVKSMREIIPGGSRREQMLNDYAELRKILGPPGASMRIADEMVKTLKNPAAAR